MASHSNRSNSPLPSRPSNLNPNPRNIENNPTTRKSFSGNSSFVKPSVLTNLRTFDPITPANSPAEFARRRSVGKGGGMASSLNNCEEKENDEKDQNSKATKLRSPAKGSKNFMSPTISAASKFTPSPRKKVLAERNDPVRTSISLSDGKAMFFSALSSDVSEYSESKCKLGFDQNQSTDSSLDLNVSDSVKNEAVFEGPTVSKPLKKVTFLRVHSDSVNASESLAESVITDSDVESSLKNKGSCSYVSPSIAPLDADPSMPPYDPKTNYLSPRPQFLYYKPNPRIEILINKNGLDPEEFVRLDDSFMAETMSENVSDSEGTEESQTEDLQKEESELTASADMVEGIDDMEVASLAFEPSESLPVSSTFLNEISEENLGQKVKKKPRGFSRLICGSLFLMFLVACVSLSVTHSPLVDEIVLKDLSFSDLSNFYHQSRVASFAKENFDWLARHVNQFQVDSMSFISNLINKLGEREKLAPLQFMNLSDLQKNIWNKERFHINQEELVENPEENEWEEDGYTEMELLAEEEYAEVDSDERFEREVDVDRLETEEISSDPAILTVLERKIQENVQSQEGIADGTKNKLQAEAKSEDYQLAAATSLDQKSKFEANALEPKISENVQSQNGIGSSIQNELQAAANSEDVQLPAASPDQESNFEAKTVEMATEITDSESFLGDTNLGSSTCADTTSLSEEISLEDDSSSEVVKSSAMLESPPRPSEEKFPSYYIIGISSISMALLTVAAAFMYQSKRISSSSNVVMQTDPFLSKKTGSELAGIDHIFQEKRFYHTEADVIGESCPSEMSSFQRSASYNNKELKGTSEVQSVEKRPKKHSKRESLASSSEYSMGSPSYGSFTTFERIPIKNNANRDEEVITPVRRSNRIRNQVTSP